MMGEPTYRRLFPMNQAIGPRFAVPFSYCRALAVIWQIGLGEAIQPTLWQFSFSLGDLVAEHETKRRSG